MEQNGPVGIDLTERAWHAMRDEGFEPELTPEAARELAEQTEAVPDDGTDRQDLRHLLWSSIDNPDSRDLDQVEVAERLADGGILVRVGIADVDSRVKAWTALDAYAARSTTSVYTGVVIFPMLPERLSTDLTSLNAGKDRAAIVTEYRVDPAGAVSAGKVYAALIHNHAKLDYETVGPWLEDASRTVPVSVQAVPGLEEQVRLQDEAARYLSERRQREGSLALRTVEARPVLTTDGRIATLAVPFHNRAHRLIENLMVAANTVTALYLAENNVPSLERIVRSPDRWGRIVDLAATFGEWLPETADAAALSAFLQRRQEADPLRFPDLSLAVVKLLGPGEYALVRAGEHQGHFGLAASAYTHSTAPNRRYPDLVTQRLLKALLAGQKSPYSESDLDVLARHCTEREDASRKVERLMRKVAAAVLLANRIGEVFEAIVTGVSARKGVFARVLPLPVEGRIVQGFEGLDVGDTVRLRLIATDPVQGFIDFARP